MGTAISSSNILGSHRSRSRVLESSPTSMLGCRNNGMKYTSTLLSSRPLTHARCNSLGHTCIAALSKEANGGDADSNDKDTTAWIVIHVVLCRTISTVTWCSGTSFVIYTAVENVMGLTNDVMRRIIELL